MDPIRKRVVERLTHLAIMEGSLADANAKTYPALCERHQETARLFRAAADWLERNGDQEPR